MRGGSHTEGEKRACVRARTHTHAHTRTHTHTLGTILATTPTARGGAKCRCSRLSRNTRSWSYITVRQAWPRRTITLAAKQRAGCREAQREMRGGLWGPVRGGGCGCLAIWLAWKAEGHRRRGREIETIVFDPASVFLSTH